MLDEDDKLPDGSPKRFCGEACYLCGETLACVLPEGHEGEHALVAEE